MKYILLLSLLVLSGCPQHVIVNSYCSLYEPVYTNEGERALIRKETLNQLQTNNAIWACVCQKEKEFCVDANDSESQ